MCCRLEQNIKKFELQVIKKGSSIVEALVREELEGEHKLRSKLKVGKWWAQKVCSNSWNLCRTGSSQTRGKIDSSFWSTICVAMVNQNSESDTAVIFGQNREVTYISKLCAGVTDDTEEKLSLK